MRAIVKGFVIGTLGLTVLFASPAVSLAERPPGCQCTCWYTDAHGKVKKGVTFIPRPDSTSCTNVLIRGIGVPCRDKAGEEHLGTKWADCKFIPGMTLPVVPGVQPPATTR